MNGSISFPGRGMNAAFAIGRLCDMDNGRKRLLQLSDSERMVTLIYFISFFQPKSLFLFNLTLQKYNVGVCPTQG